MPGVPPDAVDNVKKLLKGIFKRGKKKQDKPVDQAPPTSTQTTTAATTPAATNGGAPNTDKPLPPTHPAETLPQSDDQPTLTQQNDAQSGVVGESSQELGQEADNHTVSPTSTTPAAVSEPVSAVEKSTPPAPPPKNEETLEAPKAVETPAHKENVAPLPAAQKVETAPETATTMPMQTNGTTEEVKNVEQPTNGETVVSTGEEKVPVNEEQPSTKAVSGMSATSGPLEDFPEGAVHHQ